MPTSRRFRTHQAQLAAIVQAVAQGEAAEVTDILAAVTPGGGKSLLPVIAAHALLSAGIIERVCWVVPRDSLRLQAEEAFADPAWRAALGHAVGVRAADNAPDPCRGLQGYITTYQSVAAAPDLHLAEFRRHRTLLVVDEVHHLPALSDIAPDPLADPAADAASGWSLALLPLLETARIRLLLSGTLQRADGRSILWLPYRTGPQAKNPRGGFGGAGLGHRGLLARPGAGGAGRAAGDVRRGRRGGELARRGPHAGRPAPPVLALADGDHPPGPVHRAAHRFCRRTAARSVRRHPDAAGGRRRRNRDLGAARRRRRGASASCWWWPPIR